MKKKLFCLYVFCCSQNVKSGLEDIVEVAFVGTQCVLTNPALASLIMANPLTAVGGVVVVAGMMAAGYYAILGAEVATPIAIEGAKIAAPIVKEGARNFVVAGTSVILKGVNLVAEKLSSIGMNYLKKKIVKQLCTKHAFLAIGATGLVLVSVFTIGVLVSSPVKKASNSFWSKIKNLFNGSSEGPSNTEEPLMIEYDQNLEQHLDLIQTRNEHINISANSN